MSDVLVRNLPPELVTALKERAARKHRSLQHELHAILQAAVDAEGDALRMADVFRAKLEGRTFAASGAADIREDRYR